MAKGRALDSFRVVTKTTHCSGVDIVTAKEKAKEIGGIVEQAHVMDGEIYYFETLRDVPLHGRKCPADCNLCEP